MQKIFILLLSLFLGLYGRAQSLRGNVTDSASHQPLAGASVYFPQLKLGAVTDTKGNYKIAPLPKGAYSVELHMTGYATLSRQITIAGDEALDFAAPVAVSALSEVIVTALGNRMVIQRAPICIALK